MKNKIDKSIIGAAGEHHALSQLLRRGWIAALAYRIFDVCERKGWAKEATPYNVLVTGWGDAHRLTSEIFDFELEG